MESRIYRGCFLYRGVKFTGKLCGVSIPHFEGILANSALKLERM
jgi:hypothetical protein